MAKPKKRVHRVYLSYSSRDRWIVRLIGRQLLRCGADVFLDADKIDVGDEFAETIRAALWNADELVLYATPWGLNSKYVIGEACVAWARKIRISIILQGYTVKEFQSLPDVPVFLKQRDIIELNDVGRFLRQFKNRIS